MMARPGRRRGNEAEAFIAADPFAKAGLFERVAIQRWRKAYLEGRSCLKPQA